MERVVGSPSNPPHCPLLQKREAFCQLLQLMKNKHSHQDEPDMISVFIGTWNMGEWAGGSPWWGVKALGSPLTVLSPLQAVFLLPRTSLLGSPPRGWARPWMR